MRKYLLLVLILPELLFARLYTIDDPYIKQNIHTSVHEYTLHDNEYDLYDYHTHKHYHSGTTEHAHQHSHAKTVVNAVDFLFDDEAIVLATFSLPKRVSCFVDMLISGLFIEELLRPPIR